MSEKKNPGDALQLLDLPARALALVAKQSTRDRGHPLLGVSRRARDAVLGGLTRSVLQQSDDTTAEPLVRLLDRVCRQAPPGLVVTLLGLHGYDSEPPDEVEGVLGPLLQPTTAGGGWGNVHTLELLCWKARQDTLGPALSPRLAAAFPNLRVLLCCHVTIEGGQFFHSLLTCHHLHSLRLERSTSLDAAACDALHVLSRLPSLREISVDTMLIHVSLLQLAPLTHLTQVHLGPRLESLQEIAIMTRGMQQLQDLSLRCRAGTQCDAVALQDLLTTLPRLTRLDLGVSILNQPALDVLLQHGTHLAELQVGNITSPQPSGSYISLMLSAQVLQRLLVSLPRLAGLAVSEAHVDQAGLDVLLAHTQLTALTVASITPAHNWAGAGAPSSLQQLAVKETMDVCTLPLLPLPSHTLAFNGQLVLPVSDVPLDALPALVHQAAVYLGRCKQVACETFEYTTFMEYDSDDEGEGEEEGQGSAGGSFSPEQRIRLLEAQAPMAAHIRRLEVNLEPGWEMGRAEVEALGRAVGSRLESLTLGCGTVQPDFLPAVLSASSPLPLLTYLKVGREVQGVVQGIDLDVASQGQLTLEVEEGGLYVQ